MEDLIWAFAGLAAVVFIFGRGTVFAMLQTWERVHMAKLQARGPAGAPMPPEHLTQLHEEFARLRDTTTQHSISMQHSMERLERRVEFLEQKGAAQAMVEPVTDAPRQQVAGRL